mgnify:CR=1 FL=1
MKVKTWIRKGFAAFFLENENARKLLLDNGFSYLTEYREEILDIPEEEIIDDSGYPQNGFWYTNTLYDLVRDKSKFHYFIPPRVFINLFYLHQIYFPACSDSCSVSRSLQNIVEPQHIEPIAKIYNIYSLLYLPYHRMSCMLQVLNERYSSITNGTS